MGVALFNVGVVLFNVGVVHLEVGACSGPHQWCGGAVVHFKYPSGCGPKLFLLYQIIR